MQAALLEPIPLKPCIQHSGQHWGGVLGWGLALTPAADHMCLECADVSLGALPGPQTSPGIWTREL